MIRHHPLRPQATKVDLSGIVEKKNQADTAQVSRTYLTDKRSPDVGAASLPLSQVVTLLWRGRNLERAFSQSLGRNQSEGELAGKS